MWFFFLIFLSVFGFGAIVGAVAAIVVGSWVATEEALDHFGQALEGDIISEKRRV